MRRLLAVLAAGAAVLLVPASPVFAHASLERSEPAANSVLEESPTAVVLDFDEDVEPALSSIRVYDSAGAEVAVGDTVAGDDASILRADVPTLVDGLYAVVWQASSSDGHVVDGAFSFQVGTAATGDGDSLLQQVSGGDGDPALDTWYAVARFVSLAGVALAIGGIGWSVAGLGRLVRERRLAVVRWSAVTLLAVGSLATFLLFRSQTDDASFADVVGTPTGRMLFARVLLAVPVLALVASWGRRSAMAWRVVATAVALALGVTCSASGHPNSLDPAVVWISLDLLHVVAISVWLGGLVVLTLADRTLLSEPEAVRPVRRFSAIAMGAVVLAVLTGVVQGLRLAGGLDDVTATTWGRLLLVKVTVVVAVVAVAGVTRWLLHHEGPGSLRRTVLLEAVAVVAVLALAAGMVGQAPRAGAASRPFDEQLVANGLIASVAISPGSVGSNEVHILVSPAGGSLTPVDGAEARVSLPSASIPESPVTLVGEGPNHFSGTITFPRSGEWTFQLVVTTGSTSSVLTATVTIP